MRNGYAGCWSAWRALGSQCGKRRRWNLSWRRRWRWGRLAQQHKLGGRRNLIGQIDSQFLDVVQPSRPRIYPGKRIDASERLETIRGFEHVEPLEQERGSKHPPQFLVVLHYQDRLPHGHSESIQWIWYSVKHSGTIDRVTRAAVLELIAQQQRSEFRDVAGTEGQATIRMTDFLAAGFAGDNVLLRAARGAALTALDIFPAPRRFFARRMIFGAAALP